MHVCMYMYQYLEFLEYMYVFMYVCICVYMYQYLEFLEYMYVFMYVCICMYACSVNKRVSTTRERVRESERKK